MSVEEYGITYSPVQRRLAQDWRAETVRPMAREDLDTPPVVRWSSGRVRIERAGRRAAAAVLRDRELLARSDVEALVVSAFEAARAASLREGGVR